MRKILKRVLDFASRSPFCKILLFILLPYNYLPYKGQPYSYKHVQCNIKKHKSDMSRFVRVSVSKAKVDKVIKTPPSPVFCVEYTPAQDLP